MLRHKLIASKSRMLFIPPSGSSLDGSKSSHCVVGDSVVGDSINASSLIDSSTSWFQNSIKLLVSSIWVQISKSLTISSFEEFPCSSISPKTFAVRPSSSDEKEQSNAIRLKKAIIWSIDSFVSWEITHFVLLPCSALMSASIVICRMPAYAQERAIVDTSILFQTSYRIHCTSKRWACFP